MDAGGRRQQRGVGMRTRKTCLQIQSKPPSGSKIKASLNRNPKSLLGADAGQWLGQMAQAAWCTCYHCWGGWHRQHSARAITAAWCWSWPGCSSSPGQSPHPHSASEPLPCPGHRGAHSTWHHQYCPQRIAAEQDRTSWKWGQESCYLPASYALTLNRLDTNSAMTPNICIGSSCSFLYIGALLPKQTWHSYDLSLLGTLGCCQTRQWLRTQACQVISTPFHSWFLIYKSLESQVKWHTCKPSTWELRQKVTVLGDHGQWALNKQLNLSITEQKLSSPITKCWAQPGQKNHLC